MVRGRPAARAGVVHLDVETPRPEEWLRIGDLVRENADLPLGGTDASIVSLALRLQTDTIITFDHRRFAAVRPRHAASFRLLP